MGVLASGVSSIWGPALRRCFDVVGKQTTNLCLKKGPMRWTLNKIDAKLREVLAQPAFSGTTLPHVRIGTPRIPDERIWVPKMLQI